MRPSFSSNVAKSSAANADPACHYAPGDLIAQKYRLERLLGEGAQGSVWLAENQALGADVAIKLVRAEPADPSSTLRLEKEAHAAVKIAHPGVVRVFDFGRTANGDAFIVMEFLEGENLGERLTACGRLSPIETVRTLLPIADVLQVAHRRGIVHRDLKPENVFLAKTGESIQPKLLDFGIAKLSEPMRSAHVITQVGMLVGSPAYVSPEQVCCRDDVSGGADLWSFCVVLYECVTGVLPFSADDYRELFRRIGEDAPEPILAHGVGDFELWEILRRGLAKSPAERWPSMRALGQALAHWLRDRGVCDDISGVLVESKWLAKDRTEPLARDRTEPIVASDAFEPPSFVRRLPSVQIEPPLAPARRAPSKFSVRVYVAGAAALIAVTAGFIHSTRANDASSGERDAVSLVSVAPAKSTRPLDDVDEPRPREQQAAERPLTRVTATSATLSQPATATRTPTAGAVAGRPDGGIPPAPKRRNRRQPDDLLNPY